MVAEPEDARRTTLESSPIDQLIGEGRAEDDRPLDLDRSALDRDRDTGDGEWGSDLRFTMGEAGPDIDERADSEKTLAQYLHAQLGAAAKDPATAFIARHLVGQLDEAGYLQEDLREHAAGIGVSLAEAEAALALVHTLEPTGVGARSLGE